MGIIFIDEIDKIAGRESGHGPDVSREGDGGISCRRSSRAPRSTRPRGMIRTDHILFIAARRLINSPPT